MNKAKLTSLCHKISKKVNLSFNSVMLYYFLESILKKLSESEYNENFIFKGGFLLSNVVGINSRSTVDIDFLLKNTPLSQENILKMLTEALKEKEDDEILYEIQDISKIKEDDKYGGFSVNVLCKTENIRQVVPLDISTGDIITPHPINYNYISSFGKEDILIKAYPLETILPKRYRLFMKEDF